VYPRNCTQPIKEDYLLGGKLEKTNDAYAIAKIAGIKMCESYNEQYNMNYKCIMPTNTFGPNDKYDSLNSHFLPALIKKIHNLLNPNGIDLSSGVEVSKGIKSNSKINNLFKKFYDN